VRGSSVRLDPAPAWEGNPTHGAFIARLWAGAGNDLHLAVVNAGSTRGQCRLPIPERRLAGRSVILEDRLSSVQYDRPGNDLTSPGLYLDLEAEAYHLFRVR
jgi:hypothetical protein